MSLLSLVGNRREDEMTPDVRPVCMFCQTRFSLAAGQETPCDSWRAIDRQHAERRTATPEQHARLRLEAELREPADNMREKAKPIPAPTPFDAAALRAGKPATGQTALF